MLSSFDLIWQSMRLLSLFAGGLLADAAGIGSVYYPGGALLIAAALSGLTALSRPQADSEPLSSDADRLRR